MSYLLALCEQFRLQRKITKLTAKQIRASHRKERMTKQIERVHKMYAKRQKKIEQTASLMMKQFQVGINQRCGLGTNSWTPQMGMAGNMMNGAFLQAFAGLVNSLGSNIRTISYGGKDLTLQNLGSVKAQQMLQEYQAGTLSKTNGEEGDKLRYGNSGTYKEDEIATFYQILNGASTMSSQAQQYASNMTQMYQQNISIWQENELAELELQEDAEVAPLEEQELEWDLEKESADVQLADAKERLERIKQLVQDGTKNSAPTFGLG